MAPQIFVNGERMGFGCHPRMAAPGQAAPILGASDMVPRSAWEEVDFSRRSPEVLNQYQTYMCVAFSVVAAIQGVRQEKGLPTKSLHPGNLYARINNGIDAGASLQAALYEVKNRGVCERKSTDDPCDFRHALQAGWDTDAANYRVLEFQDCPTVDAIGSAIQNEFFTVTGIQVNDSFQPDANGVVTAPPQMGAGHAVLLVGMKKFGDAWYFKIQNSWGSHWGKDGFAYVPESYWGSGVADAWCVRSVKIV